MSRTSKSAEENLAKPNYGSTRPMSAKRLKEVRALPGEQPSEPCCGAACNTESRDKEVKLIGVREFNRLLIKTCALTEQQIYCLNVVESEYNMLLHPLK